MDENNTQRSAERRDSTGAPEAGVIDLVRGVVDLCSIPAGDRGVAEWMALIGEVGAAMNVLAAARDAAIVRLAALDEVVTEDGVVEVQVNGLGTRCVDAGAMVATATGTTTRFAEELVAQAITRVVRVPALQAEMIDGGLDDYKARCVAGELTDVPVELARTVVDALGPELKDKSGPVLRRRTRDILFTLAPELLKERLRQARNQVGVRRREGEPGVEHWDGIFPSERAATAWAAIDALARQYRLDEIYPTLEQARAHALLDLVNGNATVETVLNLTMPADALHEATTRTAGDETNSVWNEHATAHEADDDAACHQAPRDEPMADHHGRSAPAPERTARRVRPSAAALSGAATARPPVRRDETDADAHSASDPAGSVFVGVSGARGSQVAWMPLSALPGPLSCGRPDVARSIGAGTVAGVAHPVTGALLDPDDRLATEAYRPGQRLQRLIRRRDERCRFPGCVVAARQCDIDHVIPWPHGPTAVRNLICLCRRHHRVKQRHRWQARLHPDGTVAWTAPDGRTTTTDPVDHLRSGTTRVTELRALTDRDIEAMNTAGEVAGLLDALAAKRRRAAEARAEAARVAAARARAVRCTDWMDVVRAKRAQAHAAQVAQWTLNAEVYAAHAATSSGSPVEQAAAMIPVEHFRWLAAQPPRPPLTPASTVYDSPPPPEPKPPDLTDTTIYCDYRYPPTRPDGRSLVRERPKRKVRRRRRRELRRARRIANGAPPF